MDRKCRAGDSNDRPSRPMEHGRGARHSAADPTPARDTAAVRPAVRPATAAPPDTNAAPPDTNARRGARPTGAASHRLAVRGPGQAKR